MGCPVEQAQKQGKSCPVCYNFPCWNKAGISRYCWGHLCSLPSLSSSLLRFTFPFFLFSSVFQLWGLSLPSCLSIFHAPFYTSSLICLQSSREQLLHSVRHYSETPRLPQTTSAPELKGNIGIWTQFCTWSSAVVDRIDWPESSATLKLPFWFWELGCWHWVVVRYNI